MLHTGSPFYHSVLDGRMASARGPGLEKVIAHKPTTFNVFASAVGGDTSLNVNVQGQCSFVHWYTTCALPFEFYSLNQNVGKTFPEMVRVSKIKRSHVTRTTLHLRQFICSWVVLATIHLLTSKFIHSRDWRGFPNLKWIT